MKYILAAALMLASSVAAQASTFNVTFSFTNTLNGSGTGVVTGIIRGLEDDATTALGTVEILTNTDGFGIGLHRGLGNSRINLSNGAVTAMVFGAFGFAAAAPFVTDASLLMELENGDAAAGLANSAFGGPTNPNTNLQFTVTPVTMAPIPLPAAGWMLLAGLGGLAALRRRARGA